MSIPPAYDRVKMLVCMDVFYPPADYVSPTAK
jgi:hypothetical protein